MSVFYDVLMEKSAQKKEREEQQGLLLSLPLTSEDAVGAIGGGGLGYIGTDSLYRPESGKNYYRKRNIARVAGLVGGVPLGIAGDRALKRGMRRTVDSGSEEGSPIYPALLAAGGTYLGHVADQRRAQREYDARVNAREEKAKPIRKALDEVAKKISDANAFLRQGSPEARARAEKSLSQLAVEQRDLLEQISPYIGTGDKPQRLYRGKMLGAAIGGGLGYGVKKLYDRQRRSEQR